MNIGVDLSHAQRLGVKISFQKLLLLKYLFIHAHDPNVEKVLYENEVYYLFQHQTVALNVSGMSVTRNDVLVKRLKELSQMGLLKAHPRGSGYKIYTFTSLAIALVGYTPQTQVELVAPSTSVLKEKKPWFSEANPKIKWWDFIPGDLRKDDTFINAWVKWDNFRRSEKRAPLTPTSVKQQLKKMEKYGVSVSIKAIESSIDNGYQGLFFDKFKSNGRTKPTKQEIPDGEAFAQF